MYIVHTYFSIPFSIITTLYVQYHNLILSYISPTLPPSFSLILKKFSFYVHTYFSIPFSIIPTLYVQYHSLILSLIFLPLGLSLFLSHSREVYVSMYIHISPFHFQLYQRYKYSNHIRFVREEFVFKLNPCFLK